MSQPVKESSITVPADFVMKITGPSLDMGGSILKLVYRSESNMEEVENNESKYGHLQLVSFPRSSIDEALEYIKAHALTTRKDGEVPTIFTTGIGCTEFGKIICDRLSVQLKQVMEFDCFVKSFVYLASNMSRSELLERFPAEAATEVVNATMKVMSLMDGIPQGNKSSDGFGFYQKSFDPVQLTGQVVSESNDPLSVAEEDMYPCLLAMLGSGIGYMQVNKDGTFKLLDISNRGGRAFYGMGRQMTNCRNYEELIELAASGSARNVDFYSNDFFSKDFLLADGDNSMYSKAKDIEEIYSVLVYCFGKCADLRKNADDFKREDLAIACLNFTVLDIVQCVQLLCYLHGIERVFFCGSFCKSELIRETITSEMARKNISRPIYGAKPDYPVKFDFVKNGSHLGALGAMMDASVNNSLQ